MPLHLHLLPATARFVLRRGKQELQHDSSVQLEQQQAMVATLQQRLRFSRRRNVSFLHAAAKY